MINADRSGGREISENEGEKKRKINGPEFYLVVEEVDGVLVQPEGQRFEEGDIVGHDLLVAEVELVHDDGVHVVVGQQIV